MLILAILVSGCIQQPETKSSDKKTEEVKEVSKDVADKETGEKEPVVATMKDCKTSLDCLLEVVDTCGPAKVNYTSPPIDFFGALITTTTKVELKGLKDGKCGYYQEMLDQEIAFSDEYIAMAKDSNLTDSQIQEQLKVANEGAKNLIGISLDCNTDLANVVSLANDWKEGNFQTLEWQSTDCETILPEGFEIPGSEAVPV